MSHSRRLVRYTPVSPKSLQYLLEVHPSAYAPMQAWVSQQYPGTCLVFMHGIFVSWAQLRDAPMVVPTQLRVRPGEVGRCHDNVLRLLKAHQLDSAWAGFALSEDGRWRFHSWGLSADGVIIETTLRRLVYWGVPYETDADEIVVFSPPQAKE